MSARKKVCNVMQAAIVSPLLGELYNSMCVN